MEQISECGLLRSLDLVEVNPILDESNETAVLATELAASALGKRILYPWLPLNEGLNTLCDSRSEFALRNFTIQKQCWPPSTKLC